MVGEVVDLRAGVDREADGDHRLERAAEGAEVDLGVEAAHDAGLAQRAHAGQAGRGGEADALGEPVVRDPRVDAENFEDRAIDGVERLIIRHIA